MKILIKKHKLITILVILYFTGNITIHAQNVTTSTGGNAYGESGVVSYSIGQVGYYTYINTNYSEAQGVQQPYEISIITSIVDQNHLNNPISIYPNPSNEYVILKIENEEYKNLEYKLYDINGKFISSNGISEEETIIPMDKLMPSIYLIQIFATIDISNKEIKSFRIIKN